jgi:hypothetical protein
VTGRRAALAVVLVTLAIAGAWLVPGFAGRGVLSPSQAFAPAEVLGRMARFGVTVATT